MLLPTNTEIKSMAYIEHSVSSIKDKIERRDIGQMLPLFKGDSRQEQ